MLSGADTAKYFTVWNYFTNKFIATINIDWALKVDSVPYALITGILFYF